MRRFNHPQIAHMLCPQKKLDIFDEDPNRYICNIFTDYSKSAYSISFRIIGALQEGTIRTTAANRPTCFYKEGIYDPENRAKGLFCGHATFQISHHFGFD